MGIFEIKLNVTFDKEDVYTNIFGEHLLLYTIIKNIKLNDKKITIDDKKYLLEKTNFFKDFNVNNSFQSICIKEKLTNNFNGFIINGFQESIFENNRWYDRYLHKDVWCVNPNNKGLFKYINPNKQICKSSIFEKDYEFNYFIEQHENNKFNYDDDFYTIKNDDILIYHHGLLNILKDSLSVNILVENINLKNLVKYLFGNFSLDFKDDLKELIIKIHNLYEDVTLNFDNSLEVLLNKQHLCGFYYIESKLLSIVSHSFLFNIPIINQFKTQNNINYDHEISFNFIANVIPLTPDKAILIVNSDVNFDINNFNIDSINLFELQFLNNLMIDWFYRSKNNSESIKSGGYKKNVRLMNNSFIYYNQNNNQNKNLDQLIKTISKGPIRSAGSGGEGIIYCMNNIKDNLDFKKCYNKKISLKKIIDNI